MKIITIFIKKHIFFLILIPLVFVSQIFLLKPHLRYGFDDTADQYITQFRQLQEESKNPVQFVSKSLDGRLPLLWLHEHYYMWFLNHFFKDNKVAYHQATHFFKSLAILSTYPLYLFLSGSNLIAFISSLMFAISYSSAGSLEPLVVGGDYIGIIVLSAFLNIYFRMVKKKFYSKIKYYLLGLIFLILSLSIATTRTYPVILIILATEIFVLIRNSSTQSFVLVLKRAGFFLLPITLAIITKPELIIERMQGIYPWVDKYYISEGMHELLLVPFLAFASTILPVKVWPSSPLIILFPLTIIMGLLLSKKPWRFILITSLVWIIGLLIINWLWSTSSTHNFEDIHTKSIIGFYILGLAFSFFIEWLYNKNALYTGLFLGPLLSFIFIFSIWLGTYERVLVFTNIHRYLTHSSIFISFFLGSLIVVLYNRFKDSKKLKFAAFLPFLIIPIFFNISQKEIKSFYDERFEYGFTLEDQDLMRRKLLPYLSDIDIKGKRLIYIDIYSDKGLVKNSIVKNSYYYGQIYHYGPLYWLHWYDQSLYKMDFRQSHQLVPHSVFDYDILKSMVRKKGEVTGIVYIANPCCQFYKLNEFRAVRVMDREVVDIKEQVVKDLGLSP